MSKTYVTASLKRLVFELAQNACEYCLIPTTLALATHQIDHIIAENYLSLIALMSLAIDDRT